MSTGEIDEIALRRLVADGKSCRQIAAELDRSPSNVSYWLGQFGLRTSESVRRRQDDVAAGTRRLGDCRLHGEVEFVARSEGGWRCVRCRAEQVVRARQRRKEQLVLEAGGRCAMCGYDRCVAALAFHHLDPASKSFTIAQGGVARSLARMREEASKCVLLCANCHAEVEHGVRDVSIK